MFIGTKSNIKKIIIIEFSICVYQIMFDNYTVQVWVAIILIDSERFLFNKLK